MRIVTWGIGAALMAGMSTAQAASTGAREVCVEGLPDGDAVCDEELVGEVAQAATQAGTACRVACATSYTALCLRVQYLCAGVSVFTFGGATIPCASGMAAVCLTAVAVGVICNDRCPP